MTSSGRYSILLVDDEPMLLESMKALLSIEYTVFTATSGNDALAIMEQNDIALVITDYQIPDMSGSKLLEMTRQKHPGTIRMMLSGCIDQDMFLRCSSHAHAVLSKPWRNGELEFTISRWLEQYRKLREYRIIANSSMESDDTNEVARTASRIAVKLYHNISEAADSISSLLHIAQGNIDLVRMYLYSEQMTARERAVRDLASAKGALSEVQRLVEQLTNLRGR